MDPRGHIYELSEEEQETLANPSPEPTAEERAKFDALREDVARLDGFLRGRAESDAPKRGKGANKDLAG